MARAPRAAAAAPVEPPVAAPVEPPAPAPAPVPAPEPPASEPSLLDAFDAAFAEAAAAAAEPQPEPAKAAPAAPRKPATPPKPAEPKPDELPEGKPAAVPESPTPAEPSQQPHPGPHEQPQPQPQNPPPPPQPQQPHAYAQPQQEPPLFNAEEVAQLQTFYADWPDVARAAETMIRGITAQTVRRMYADMAASLAPYLQTIDTLADRSQLSELQTQVTDYDTVAGQLTSWASRQPMYLRSAYEHVIKSGTAAEVVDLINRFKQDMGQSTTPAQGATGTQPAAPAAAAPAPAPVNPALAAAAARLAPVATKRTNVVAPPADFDTAFAEFARAS